jgi:hypothetical protein
MSSYHIVAQGEHLSSIAEQYGFSDYRTIWNHPDNAELKQRRPDPHVLFPGDRVFIPDLLRKKEAAETSRRTRFRLQAPRLMLRLQVKDYDDQPIINTACTLEVEGATYELVTDANGQIQQPISVSARAGKLKILDHEMPVQIGHLDPVEEVSGQQARLNNLGYDAGEVGETDEAKLRSALEEFQCDHNLMVDGTCNPQTQARLLEVHGC